MAGLRNNSTEDSILGQLQSDTDDDFLSNDSDTGADEGDLSPGNGEGGKGDTDVSANAKTTPAVRPGNDPQQPGKQPVDAKGDKKQVPADQGEQVPVGRNAKGDLVDKNGNVIARSGGERRYVENLNRRNQDLERDLRAANDKLNTNQALNGLPQKLGINTDDMVVGLQLVAQFNKDPVAAARNVLERALALGHNLSDILGQGTDTVDLRAQHKMLDDRLAPLVNKQKQEEQSAQVEEDARKNYTKFMTEYPEAEHHQDAIANLMQTKGVTAERALYMVQTFARKNGLDFDQPLGPQIAARQGQDPNPAGNGQVPHNPKPIGANGGGGAARDFRSTEPASADASFESIIRDAMREAGLPG